MNRITTAIKGILLSSIFIGAFLLAGNPVTDHTSNQQVTGIQIEVQDFIPQAFAENGNFLDEIPSGSTPDVETGAAQTNPHDVEGIDSNDDDNNPEEAFDPAKLINTIAEIATYTHRFFHPLINFFAFNVGNFLGTDYIFEGNMGGMLKSIWTVSRNLVNIVFVLILLGLALKEIFWVTEEGGGTLKKNLIKFTLLLIAVNFSWLGAKVVLDAANVATNVVFSIPMGVSSIGDGIDYTPCDVNTANKETTGMCYPSAIFGPVDSDEYNYLPASECGEIEKKYDTVYNQETGELNEGLQPSDKEGIEGVTTFCWDNIDLFKYNKNTSVIYLTFGMARIQNLVTASNTGDGIVQLSVAIVMSLVLQVAYTIALLALFIALIIRMAMLWIFVAFSPFLVLMMFSEKFSQEIGDKFSIKEFANWAFVPAKVGAVFSVAFLMVSAGQSLTGFDTILSETEGGGGVTITAKMFKIKSLLMGMDSIQEFIWLLITLAILWMGVFAVLGKMPIVSSVTNQIDDYGKRTAKWLGKSPYWAPIMPMVDPQGNFKFGSYAKEYGTKLDIARQLEEAGLKYTRPASAADYNQLNRTSQEFKNSPGQRREFMDLVTGKRVPEAAGMTGVSLDRLMEMDGGRTFENWVDNSGFSDREAIEIKSTFKQIYREGVKTDRRREAEDKKQTAAADRTANAAERDAAAGGAGGTPPATEPPAAELPEE
ncbi:hypothetical protein KKF04_04685 [Patescibacteria group bacterium]|nr:hypothetical protein [Patescibacteria group bacterium]